VALGLLDLKRRKRFRRDAEIVKRSEEDEIIVENHDEDQEEVEAQSADDENTVVTGDQVTRNKKRKLSSGGDVKVKACKPSISGWKRRFDAFPFFTPDIQCYRTQQVPDTKAFKIECVPTYERRHILKLKGGCNSSGSPDEEVWEHSWEEVISGCDTVFIF